MRQAGGKPSKNQSAADSDGTYWIFGMHAVRAALVNPRRVKNRLILTPNSARDLAAELSECAIQPEISDPRRFSAPLDRHSVHQGAALLTEPLDWGQVQDVCFPEVNEKRPVVLLLDRVTDPHNVGAILRSSEVFGARAVIAPWRHSAPETGALAKVASGALERQPYLRVRNLSGAMEELRDLGYALIGLDGEVEVSLSGALAEVADRPVALALGAEGPGLRQKTRETCDILARIPSATDFASLNVSNAAAVALYAAHG